MNIIYRVYKIINDNSNLFETDKMILNQDVMMCNSKDDFKEAIKLIYGDDIKFKHTKDLKVGDLFISIVSYNCYNAEEYVSIQDYTCCNCGKNFKSNKHNLNKSYSYYYLEKICKPLYDERIKELENNIYCGNSCKREHEEKLKEEFTNYAKENNYLSDFWVDRYDTYNTSDYGYIYMISKKSTGEFYVGQTNAVPMFRWVQHLKTERFKIDNIVDYKFEVLETVKYKKDINNREAYWINKKYEENPKLSLNILMPKVKE